MTIRSFLFQGETCAIWAVFSMAGQDIPSAIITAANGGSVLDPAVTRRILNSVLRPKPDDARVAGPKR